MPKPNYGGARGSKIVRIARSMRENKNAWLIQTDSGKILTNGYYGVVANQELVDKVKADNKVKLVEMGEIPAMNRIIGSDVERTLVTEQPTSDVLIQTNKQDNIQKKDKTRKVYTFKTPDGDKLSFNPKYVKELDSRENDFHIVLNNKDGQTAAQKYILVATNRNTGKTKGFACPISVINNIRTGHEVKLKALRH